MADAGLAIGRRGFLASSAAAGLILGIRLNANTVSLARVGADSAPLFDNWLQIRPDGQVIVLVNCCEMGQGSQTSFAQLVADELEADWSMVSVQQAPVEPTYYNAWGIYSTGGSGAIRQHFDKLRKAGAAARAMLVEAAARRWKVPASELKAEAGVVRHAATGRSAGYGELAVAAGKLPVPKEPPLKPRSEWKFIGKPVERLDLRQIVDGSNVYGVDVRMPKLLVATIAQSPVFGGKLVGVDERPALAVRGVKRVLRLSGGRIPAVDEQVDPGKLTETTSKLSDAVVVVADGYWPALKGLRSLQPRWDPGTMAGVSTPDIEAGLLAAMRSADTLSFPDEAQRAPTRGAVEKALRAVPRAVEAEYRVPLLSQSPLEPMNGTAWVRGGTAELWLPTQSQSTVREAVAKALGLKIEKVVVHTTRLGGGFGRRLESDYAVQAALISQAMGAPVKLIWSRQEDTKHGFYRPAAVARMRAAVDADGSFAALEMRTSAMEEGTLGGLDANPYDLGPAIAFEKVWNPGVPIGSWRAVALSYTTFFLESFIDEVAHSLSIDPVDYRRRLLGKNPRMIRVLDAAARAAGWGTPSPGRFRGLAIMGGAWRAYCAQVVELSVTADRRIRVHKVTCAIDSGTFVNPDQVRAQVEGAIVFGLGAALYQQITLRNGSVEQSTYRDFPVIKLADMPQIETVLLDSPDEKVGGVGETPVLPIAPALCNALHAATGERVRQLPLSANGFRHS